MMQVKKGTRYWLHWPPDVANPIEPRGGPGTVVDDEHPLEAVRNEDGEVVGGFLRGQMHKLEPVSKKRKPTPIDHPVARGLYREYENEQQRAKAGLPPKRKRRSVQQRVKPSAIDEEPVVARVGKTIPDPEPPTPERPEKD